jgi:hypothetical protein
MAERDEAGELEPPADERGEGSQPSEAPSPEEAPTDTPRRDLVRPPPPPCDDSNAQLRARQMEWLRRRTRIESAQLQPARPDAPGKSEHG